MVDYDVITYTRPDTQVIDISNPPYMLVGHDGFGIGDMEQTWVSPPGLHGAYLFDTRMGPKVVTVEFEVHDIGVIERQNDRREIIRMFNPLLGPGVLRLDQVNGVSRAMRCVLAESMSMPTQDYLGVGAAHFTARFQSHGIPGTYDPNPVVQAVTASTGGNFSFPWQFPIMFSQSGYFNRIVCNNAGDLDTPVTIQMIGPLANPTFKNETTNEILSLTGLSLAAGQTLDISTDPQNLVVQVNGVDAWQYIYDASFWTLQPGANSILFDVGGSDPTTHGTISWYSYYLGQ